MSDYQSRVWIEEWIKAQGFDSSDTDVQARAQAEFVRYESEFKDTIAYAVIKAGYSSKIPSDTATLYADLDRPFQENPKSPICYPIIALEKPNGSESTLTWDSFQVCCIELTDEQKKHPNCHLLRPKIAKYVKDARNGFGMYTNDLFSGKLDKELETSNVPSLSRDTVVVIVCEVQGIKSFHFTSGQLQTAGGRELWFPIEGGLFESIERVLQVNYIANNVANLTTLRIGDTYRDIEVEYNVYQTV